MCTETSLASIYGLMSETSPASHLPTSPLMRSFLDDTNLALPKFCKTRLCTVSCLCPVVGIEGTTVHPLPLFWDRIQSLLGLPQLPWRKLVRPGNIPFLCLPHRSPRWRPCFPGYARWPLGWTGVCPLVEVSGRICL